MFRSRISLRRDLRERAEAVAGKLGCTLNELVERAVEVELERLMNENTSLSTAPSDAEVDEILGKLKGLGYID